MIAMLKEFEKGNKLNINFITWESTDGCYKQYRCSVLMYFVSLLSFNFNITIDRMIGAQGHGKYIVDAINNCNKRYFKEKIRMSRIPEAGDSTKIMEAHGMVGESKLS